MNELLTSIVLPAYNEERTLAEDVTNIRNAFEKAKQPYEIIVVDDGSTDKTAQIAQGLSGVRIIQHRVNRGVGAARKSGILAARSEYVITTDTDGTYPNFEMPRLVQMLEEYEMVVGSRTGKNVAVSWVRWPAKFLIRKLACYLTRTDIPDLNSGLRAFRKSVALKFFYLLPESHSWESTITLAFLCNHHRVKFEPVDYYKRKGGKSSFHPFYDTYNYIQLVIRTVMYFNPLRMFIPLSAITFLVAFGKSLYDWIIYHHIGGVDIMIFVLTVMLTVAGLLADLIVVLHKKYDQTVANFSDKKS